MAKVILRRIVLGFIALFVAMLILFSLSRATGDPRYIFIGPEGIGIDPEVWDLMGEKLHLDKPVPVQFAYWVSDMVRGDFGESIALQRPVLPVSYTHLTLPTILLV